MGQSLNPQVTPSLFCKRLLPRHKTPRLAAVLFQQGHAVDGHAPVHGFAHVVDGQQGELTCYVDTESSHALFQFSLDRLNQPLERPSMLIFLFLGRICKHAWVFTYQAIFIIIKG